jgi:hypothetical protein
VFRFFVPTTAGGSKPKFFSAIVFCIAALLVAYEAAQIILANDWNIFALVGIGTIGMVCAIKILNNWRDGLYIFFGWLFVEDFARKYLGNNLAMFFAKDILVVLVYISFYAARRSGEEKATFRPPFLVPLLLFIWFAAGQVFNFGSTSVFFGFLGLKLYFLYVPLMYLGYALINSEQDLRRFFVFNSILIVAVASLGIAQSIIGPTFLNPSVLQEEIREMSTLYRVSPITGLVSYRPCSVFVSAGRFQNFLVGSWIIILGFGGYLILRTKKGRTATFLAIGILAGAALMSTSRGVMMWSGGSALVVMAAFVWGAPWKQREATRVIRSIQRTILFGGLAIVTLAVIFPEEVNSRLAVYSETLSPYSTASELASRTRDYPLKNFLAAFDTPRWMYGYGTGTASLGIQYVARVLHAPPTGVTVESGYGQLVIEMGVVGLLLWLVLGASISISAWRIAKKLRGSPWFPLAFVIFWFIFMVFFPMGYNTLTFYQDFLVNAYLWILVGILYRLPGIALSAPFVAEGERVSSRNAPRQVTVPCGAATNQVVSRRTLPMQGLRVN